MDRFDLKEVLRDGAVLEGCLRVALIATQLSSSS